MSARNQLLSRTRLTAVFLALVAVAILLGLGTHGHHDECYDYCWICHSSVAEIGLPAATVDIVVVWSSHTLAYDTILALHDLDANLHTAPRAPPC